MKKERKKRIREHFQKGTEEFLSGAIRKMKLDKPANNLLNWAENHRKGMFAITISFLSFVVIVSFAFRPKTTFMEVYKGVDSVKVNNPMSKGKLNTAFELTKIQQEISGLQCKGKLTPEDTIKIKELYKKLTNYKNNDK